MLIDEPLVCLLTSQNKDIKAMEILPQKRWYIFYLCSRSEKKVYHDLTNRKYEVFLPLVKEMKVWRNRQKKIVEIPLFSGYIFVNVFEDEIYRIVRLPKVVKFLLCAGKPSTLSNDEVDSIRQMINSKRNICVENQCRVGDQVEVISGPLVGYQGILIKEKGKCQFGIQLDKMNHTMLIEINENEIVRL
jgi:transcription antitermination factor NusG